MGPHDTRVGIPIRNWVLILGEANAVSTEVYGSGGMFALHRFAVIRVFASNARVIIII